MDKKMHESNEMFNGFVGKTVARVEYVITRKDGCDYKDELTLHFTDGSMLTVCENDPDIYLNGLDVCASINEENQV